MMTCGVECQLMERLHLHAKLCGTTLHSMHAQLSKQTSHLTTVNWTAVRDREYRSYLLRQDVARHELPRFTRRGFATAPIPAGAWGWLRDFHEAHRHLQEPEPWRCDGWNSTDVSTMLSQLKSDAAECTEAGWSVPPCAQLNPWEARTQLLRLPADEKRRLSAAIEPHVAAWVGRRIEPTVQYGPRVYNDGASLNMHVDRRTTHVLGVILHIAEASPRAAWPLRIEDHDGAWHEVTLREGEMLMYESATLMHGRLAPFRGAEYVNFFLHYRPRGGDGASGDGGGVESLSALGLRLLNAPPERRRQMWRESTTALTAPAAVLEDFTLR